MIWTLGFDKIIDKMNQFQLNFHYHNLLTYAFNWAIFMWALFLEGLALSFSQNWMEFRDRLTIPGSIHKKNNSQKKSIVNSQHSVYYYFEFPYWSVWSAQRVCSICLMKFIRNSQSICRCIQHFMHTPISLSDIKIKCFVFLCCAKTNTRTIFHVCDYFVTEASLFFLG